MKRYIFKDNNGEVLATVQAENHDEALKKTDNPKVSWETDYDYEII